MVGAKSLGCSTCKGRRIKCDERFPTCFNCERAKRHCTGPKSKFIRFVQPGKEEHAIGEKATISLGPARSKQELLAVELVSRLSETKEIGYQLQALGNLFAYLPSRVGHNPALDAAVRCLLRLHQKLLCQNTATCDTEMRDYSQALRLIRTDIDLHQSRTPSETICAALILTTYEDFSHSTDRAWIAHAGGVSALIEAWGPNRITSEFDLAIFASHYGNIAVSSIFLGKDCFLVSPKWEAVRRKCVDLNIHPRIDSYLFQSLAAFALVPSLLRDIQDSSPGMHDSSVQKALRLKAEASKYAVALKNDFMNSWIVHESLASRSNFMPTKYEFCDDKVAFHYCYYWATTIIANTMLCRLGVGDSYLEMESYSAAANICKSMEYFRGLKPLGVLPLSFMASMAYGMSSTERRAQIAEEMEGLFEALPTKIGAQTMDYTFGVMTGTLGVYSVLSPVLREKYPNRG